MYSVFSKERVNVLMFNFCSSFSFTYSAYVILGREVRPFLYPVDVLYFVQTMFISRKAGNKGKDG